MIDIDIDIDYGIGPRAGRVHARLPRRGNQIRMEA